LPIEYQCRIAPQVTKKGAASNLRPTISGTTKVS